MKKKDPTHYKCPDCGWEVTTRARRIRCGGCGSLNLERELADGSYWKADRADPKICRDCQTLYGVADRRDENMIRIPYPISEGNPATCPECGGDEVWDPYEDNPDWFKQE